MQEPKKRGRPPKPAAERRRHNQTFRCNDEMLAKLQEAADKNQRSLSEEVERRIEESFSKENLIEEFRSVSYATSEQAWDDYVKRIAGEQRFLSFGLDAASTLRYAMRDLDIFESKISDIVKSKDHLDFITQKFLHQLPAMLKWVDSSEFNSAVEITKNAMRRSVDEALDVKDEK